MAYTADNLAMVYNSVGGSLPRTFMYLNATPDANAVIVAAGYSTDFAAKGGRVGDIVWAINTGTARKTEYQCTAVSAAGAATWTVPVAIA
jgi:hypothetical protein